MEHKGRTKMAEGPYKFHKLPKGWKWVRLEEVAQTLESGFAFRKKRVQPHLRPYNIGEDGTIRLDKLFFISRDKVPKNKVTLLQPGDVLFNNTNSVELVGKTTLVTQPMEAGFSNHITLIRTKPGIEGAWLALVLRAWWHQGFFARICNKWIGQAGINTETLKHIPIPLPSLPEQRRIVARIEELMERVREARRLREEAKKDADRLMQAALAEVFPRPGDPLPPGWQWVRLGEVCEHKSGIWGPKAKAPTDGFPIVRSTEIAGHRIDPQSASIRSVPLGKAQRYALQSGDILINKSSGSPHLVGWPAIFEDPGDGRMYLFSNFMLRLRVDKSRVNPWFMLYYLHSPVARANYLGAQDTTSGLRNLRVRDFMAQLIPLPPLPEQRRIVAYLDQVQARVTALKKSGAGGST